MTILYKTRAFGLAALLGTTLCLFSGPSPAQTQSGAFAPSVGQAGKDVIWVPTPDRVVERMLRMAEVGPNDFVIDLGSGDGKITIAAARTFGARAMGLEYNPDMVELSQRRSREAGVADKVEFRQADIFASDFSRATVLTMYLLPGLNLKLRPIIFRMKPGTRIASHSFDMGSWTPDETSVVGSARTYLWIVPANVQGEWKVSFAGNRPGAPSTLNMRQRYQKLAGDASYGELDVSLRDPLIDGDTVSFSIHDQQGRKQQFSGRVNGNQITGTVTTAGQPAVNFTATRSGQPQRIDESSSDNDRFDKPAP